MRNHTGLDQGLWQWHCAAHNRSVAAMRVYLAGCDFHPTTSALEHVVENDAESDNLRQATRTGRIAGAATPLHEPTADKTAKHRRHYRPAEPESSQASISALGRHSPSSCCHCCHQPAQGPNEYRHQPEFSLNLSLELPGSFVPRHVRRSPAHAGRSKAVEWRLHSRFGTRTRPVAQQANRLKTCVR
jgi:hypothetical protein